MRYVLVGALVASSFGGASADPLPESGKAWERPNTAGVFLEISGGWERLHPPNGLTYRAGYLRFAPGVSLNHFLYLGAAMQLGRIYSAYGVPDSALAAIPANDFTDEGNGSTLAGQVFLGVRDLIGIVAVGGEVAPTLRETSAGMNFEYAADKSYVTTIEVHGRVDVWATPHLSVGVMAGMDIASIRDFEAGLQLGFHLEPYDAMNR
ncbi:MAG: hypothetical protein ABI591_19515 [Kofleriaceae bacterium]